MRKNMTRQRAQDQLAEIVRSGKTVSPKKYRRLVELAGYATTEDIRREATAGGRSIGTIRTSIDWIDGVPAFMKDTE